MRVPPAPHTFVEEGRIMTTPIVPPRLVTAAQANPPNRGLYAAAALVDIPDPSRIAGGIELESVNCGVTGVFDPDCGAVNDDKVGDPAGWESFAATTVWSADSCGTIGRADDEARQRAMHVLMMQESAQVEKWISDELLSRSTAAGTVDAALTDVGDRFVAALGTVEDAMPAVPGVVHVSIRYAALAASQGLIVRQSGVPTTPAGNRWAFGAGYGALGERLVGTGPVSVYRGTILDAVRTDVKHNDRLAVAEREVAVGWECGAVSATFGVA